MQKAYGFLRLRINQNIGSIGEQAFAQDNKNFIHQPFSISKRLPFIFGTPDFIITNPNILIVEIKNSTEEDRFQRFLIGLQMNFYYNFGWSWKFLA
jgi:hypothetical protein